MCHCHLQSSLAPGQAFDALNYRRHCATLALLIDLLSGSQGPAPHTARVTPPYIQLPAETGVETTG